MRSKTLSAVTAERKMTPKEAADFHLRKCGVPFGAWHKPRWSRVTSPQQAKFGPGYTFKSGSNAAKRARRAKLEERCDCGRKRKNCGCL